MESSLNIPFAVPYPWTVSERQATRIVRTGKRKIGSGVAYLESIIHNSNNPNNVHSDDDDDEYSDDNNNTSSRVSSRARRLLEQLLEQPNSMTTMTTNDDQPLDTSHLQSSTYFSSPFPPQVLPPLPEGEEGNNSEDVALQVVNLAQNGEVSLLLQILKCMDEQQQQQQQRDTGSEQGVPAKALIRSCALCVNASKTPGMLDAKEMVLAALQFLSSSAQLHCYSSHGNVDDDYDDDDDDDNDDGAETTITLPLLEADSEQQQEDPEKRVYSKVGDWKWTDFQTRAFGELQLAFDSSPRRREAFVPRFLVSDADESRLLQKGVIPPSAAPKRKGPTPGYRRNTGIGKQP